MILSEATLAPYRIANGRLDSDLPFSGMAGFYLETKLPDDFFSPTWKFFSGQLKTSDGGSGLEIVLLLAFTEKLPVLTRAREWIGLVHQGGGHANQHPRIIATQLKPRAGYYPALRQLARDRWRANGGHLHHGSVRATDVAAYHADLTKIGVNCDFSYPHLIEGFYPIDAPQANLDLLAEDAPRLEDIAKKSLKNHDRKNLALIVLTANSD